MGKNKLDRWLCGLYTSSKSNTTKGDNFEAKISFKFMHWLEYRIIIALNSWNYLLSILSHIAMTCLPPFRISILS